MSCSQLLGNSYILTFSTLRMIFSKFFRPAIIFSHCLAVSLLLYSPPLEEGHTEYALSLHWKHGLHEALHECLSGWDSGHMC